MFLRGKVGALYVVIFPVDDVERGPTDSFYPLPNKDAHDSIRVCTLIVGLWLPPPPPLPLELPKIGEVLSYV